MTESVPPEDSNFAYLWNVDDCLKSAQALTCYGVQCKSVTTGEVTLKPIVAVEPEQNAISFHEKENKVAKTVRPDM